LQLRGKSLSTLKFVESAKLAQQVLEEFPASTRAPLIINDRVDVAMAVNADGVHVGQEDLPAHIARRLLGPNKILGVTVSSPAQAKKALFDGADYLGTDAIFPTPTKPESNVLGLDKFSRICASTSLPILGIGGSYALSK
jgi:thiamine-phosphate pyrophosphorylase